MAENRYPEWKMHVFQACVNEKKKICAVDLGGL